MHWQKLDRDQTIEVGVSSLVNNSHATATNLFNQFVMGYNVVDHDCTLMIQLFRVSGRIPR
jgi:hypothetical protein